MSSPQVNTTPAPSNIATKQEVSSPERLVDSATMQSPQSSTIQSSADHIHVSNIEVKAQPVDEKERRLVDYVSKMDELRMTTGEEGYKIQQGIKVKTIVKSLLEDSDKV
jgi:hypothetical protein